MDNVNKDADTQTQIVLPLDLTSEEGRLSWNGTYYALSAALCLPGRAETKEEVDAQLREALLVVKLVPFRDKLRGKMFAMLADNDETKKAALAPAITASVDTAKPAWGAVAKISIAQGLLICIDDVRKALPRAGALPGEEFDPQAAESVVLPEAELESLRKALQAHLDATLLPYVREPFASFAPEGLSAWKKRIPQIRASTKDPTALVPYQWVFTDSFPLVASYEGGDYQLDDLYCVRPGCPCIDVTCIVLKTDPHSGQNAAVAGFKYQLDSGRMRAMSEFPGKFNASEWFKRFSRGHPVNLDLVLKSRYAFMRNDYIAAAKAQAPSS